MSMALAAGCADAHGFGSGSRSVFAMNGRNAVPTVIIAPRSPGVVKAGSTSDRRCFPCSLRPRESTYVGGPQRVKEKLREASNPYQQNTEMRPAECAEQISICPIEIGLEKECHGRVKKDSIAIPTRSLRANGGCMGIACTGRHGTSAVDQRGASPAGHSSGILFIGVHMRNLHMWIKMWSGCPVGRRFRPKNFLMDPAKSPLTADSIYRIIADYGGR